MFELKIENHEGLLRVWYPGTIIWVHVWWLRPVDHNTSSYTVLSADTSTVLQPILGPKLTPLDSSLVTTECHLLYKLTSGCSSIQQQPFSGYLNQVWKWALIGWRPTAPLHHSAAVLAGSTEAVSAPCTQENNPGSAAEAIPRLILWSVPKIASLAVLARRQLWYSQIHYSCQGV